MVIYLPDEGTVNGVKLFSSKKDKQEDKTEYVPVNSYGILEILCTKNPKSEEQS